GEAEIVEQQVELADVAARLSGNPKAVWFKQAGAEAAELAGNVDADRGRIAGKGEIVEVPSKAAPVQQVVLTGDQIDVTALPVHLQHGQDGGPYISASVDFAVDAQTGLVNSGLRRLMLRGKR